MIVCRKCSRRYADGTEFCSCGAYLQFDGEHVADPVDLAPPSAPTPLPPSPPSGTTQSEPARWAGLPGETSWGTYQPAGSGVDARLPDVPTRSDTTEPVWVESTGRAGDVRCRNCSTPNAPGLQFCRHCGQPLHGSTAVDAAARTAGTTPWWRRLGRQARRRADRADPTAMAYSARRLSSGGVGGRAVMFRSGMVAAALFGLLAFLGPWRRTVIDGAKDLLGGERFDEVGASDVRVSSVATAPPGEAPQSFAQQGPENLTDDYANTTWATRWLAVEAPGTVAQPDDDACVVGARTDAAVRFTFPDETDLAKIAVLGGRHTEDESAGTFSRPRVIELEVGGECEHIELASEGELEIHDFSHRNVEVVELRVVDIVADPEQSPTVEIAEVVFGEE